VANACTKLSLLYNQLRLRESKVWSFLNIWGANWFSAFAD